MVANDAIVSAQAWRNVSEVARSSLSHNASLTKGGKMQSVVRSTFFAGALALVTLAGVTACGDKVKVSQTAPDSTVQSVTVTPGQLNLNVGDKATLAASVQAGPGVTDRTVTWTSSNTAVATVDNNGGVTAVAGGN